MQKITQEIINYFRNERAGVRQWCRAQSWRTAITLVGLALLAQAVLWVSNSYFHVHLVLLAAALGVYVFTSLRWLQEDRGWHALFMGFMMVVLFSLAFILSYIALYMDVEAKDQAVAAVLTAMLALFTLATFIEDKTRSWLHVRVPMVMMVGIGILLGLKWMWLGLLFPAVVLILARLARYVIFLFRLFIGNPVLHFVRKDQR